MLRTFFVTFLTAAATLVPAQGAGAELKIGVVNVREILSRYKKAADLQGKDLDRFRSEKEKIERRRRELAARLSRFQSGPEGSQDLEKLRQAKQLETAEFVLKLDYRKLQQDVQQARDRVMLLVMEDIRAAAGRLARAEAYDLVLKYYGRDPTATTDRAKIEVFQLDVLLSYGRSVDITERVLEILEEAYRENIKLVPDDAQGSATEDTESTEKGSGTVPSVISVAKEYAQAPRRKELLPQRTQRAQRTRGKGLRAFLCDLCGLFVSAEGEGRG